LVKVTVSMHPVAVFLGPAEIEARPHATRALDRQLGFGQVDLMRGEHELGLGRELVSELEVDRGAARGEID
jgi:hypothetical protein